jgi:hypothetical protein
VYVVIAIVPKAISTTRSTSCSQETSVAHCREDSPRLSMSTSHEASVTTASASSPRRTKHSAAQLRTMARGRSSTWVLRVGVWAVRSMPFVVMIPSHRYLASGADARPDSLSP